MKFSIATFAGAACLFASATGAHAQSATGFPTTGTSTSSPPSSAQLQVVDVDLGRYAGTWYEQARLPAWFQRKCTGQVAALYTVRADGHLDVLNRCAQADGTVDEATGEGRRVPVPGRLNAGRLEVRFVPGWLSWLPLVWGDYWILQLDPEYQVALVGSPDRKYLWVLSRQPRLDDARLQATLDIARAAGFEVASVQRTPATPSLNGPPPAR